jgi:hypothetical protein
MRDVSDNRSGISTKNLSRVLGTDFFVTSFFGDFDLLWNIIVFVFSPTFPILALLYLILSL